jgi:uncharacterized protein (TIGR02453 family)
VAGRSYFTRDTFRFLRDLKENNDRDWFAENKHRYEDDLKAPALRLIEDFGQRLPDLSPHFKATPRSLFRIYRDVRFSKDKSPYKTAVGIQFRHEQAKDAYAPGFYFHIAPGEVFAALGVWHPPSKALRAIRDSIVDHPDAWTAASGDERFSGTFALEGESLKRAPKGFDPEHPLIEDLRRKDFIGVASLTQAFATSKELPDALTELYGDGMPLMRFLCDALSVPI